ncbi:MAG: hypothetical protein GAK41_01544 [Burkholderia gladioli]|nr:MAG: hypothetical protein GAK41_01544 [Burkholderia gladioli]
MLAMLHSVELDAAIFGNDLPDDPDFAPLIPDAAVADQAWYAQHRFVQINHVVTVTQAATEAHPEAIRAVYKLLCEGKAVAAAANGGAGKPDKLLAGYDALRGPLQETIAACEAQQLLPRALSVDEIFADSHAILGDIAR